MKEISMLQKLPVHSNKLFIWVFIPYCITEKGLISEDYDNDVTRQELADVFAQMGLAWKWQPITFENMHAVVEEVGVQNNEYVCIVLNLCDGFDEIDGYPGVSVIKLLEAKNIIFTGADSHFCNLSDNKILMKQNFVNMGVATAAYEVISNKSDVKGICQRLGTPLIVKPAISYAANGLSLQSIVHTDEQVSLQIQNLLQGQEGKSIFVEQFINGSEFTVFLIGSAKKPDSIKIYPPLERIFHPSLPEIERIYTMDVRLEKEKEVTSLTLEKQWHPYQLVTGDLRDRLWELSKRAYCVLGGSGYGRVDIRMDKASGELFVLEVNPNCAICSQSVCGSNPITVSVGTILSLARIPHTQLISEIIAEAFAIHSVKSVD